MITTYVQNVLRLTAISGKCTIRTLILGIELGGFWSAPLTMCITNAKDRALQPIIASGKKDRIVSLVDSISVCVASVALLTSFEVVVITSCAYSETAFSSLYCCGHVSAKLIDSPLMSSMNAVAYAKDTYVIGLPPPMKASISTGALSRVSVPAVLLDSHCIYSHI